MSSRTPEERRELATRAGKASGKSRGEKGVAIRAARIAMSLMPAPTPEVTKALVDAGFDMSKPLTVLTVGMTQLALKASRGDANALGALVDFAGESYAQKQKDEEIEIKRDSYLLSVDQNNKAPKDLNVTLKYVVDEVTE
jgi:hypothetical protein